MPAHGYPISLPSTSRGAVRHQSVCSAAPYRVIEIQCQARQVPATIQPDVVLGMGLRLQLRWRGRLAVRHSLLLHEQNTAAGLTNKLLPVCIARRY